MPEKKKSQKAGRDKVKCAAYRAHQTREKHKIRNIAKSSGEKAALKYATAKGLLGFAQKRVATIIHARKEIGSGTQRPERRQEVQPEKVESLPVRDSNIERIFYSDGS